MGKSIYKVGDTVVIKRNLVPDMIYDGVSFVGSMLEYCGKHLVIDSILNNRQYKTEGNIFVWTAEMIDGVVVLPKPEVITVPKPLEKEKYKTFTVASYALYDVICGLYNSKPNVNGYMDIIVTKVDNDLQVSCLFIHTPRGSGETNCKQPQ